MFVEIWRFTSHASRIKCCIAMAFGAAQRVRAARVQNWAQNAVSGWEEVGVRAGGMVQ